MIFLMALAGAAIGAASGALDGALADVGINDRFVRDAAQGLQAGNAALFLLVRKMTTDKVLAALQGEGGTVTRTSFDEQGGGSTRGASRRHSADRGACRLKHTRGFTTFSTSRRSTPNDDHSTASAPATNTTGVLRGAAAGPPVAVAAWAGGREAGAGPMPRRADKR
jgi:hypothetical protein